MPFTECCIDHMRSMPQPKKSMENQERAITNRVEKVVSIKEIYCFSVVEYLFVDSIDKYDILLF